MPRPMLQYGLYGWSPAYGYSYIHPANRRSFEWVEPLDKVFEKIGEDEEWITLRYDERNYLVRPELFRPIDRPPFGFGDAVETVNWEPGQPRLRGVVSDIFWDESAHRARYQMVVRKKKVPQVYEADELRNQ
ncbi:hypothetical protein F0P96_17480 [Hymenobacter busanensis]|uniref:Uncharacterized protein n=1 Tax=Hymenobacter busanensis TaxID=2607656 RepID=A0A7L5A353_9BACT|nr:hypothetical protein [Hymenobacter busanensis]KAA9327034.1 hypothetical protein F0P96_17480 [Hymenobacter busanensis]QHJ09485.1 hypothetical protein GUY19_20295 [Hymenobacter busanensis]